MLMWLGTEAWLSAQHRQNAAIALVIAFALLDITAWLFAGVNAYAG